MQDVRRSDQTEERAESDEAGSGFARSLFRLGPSREKQSKRIAQKLEQDRLNGRLREVLERDRALVAAQPARTVPGAHGEPPDHDDDVWLEPFEETERQTGTRERGWFAGELDAPFGVPAETGTRPVQPEQRISQIAAWIEEELDEELDELADGVDPLALLESAARPLDVTLNADEVAALEADRRDELIADAIDTPDEPDALREPLGEDEAAELDAVLAPADGELDGLQPLPGSRETVGVKEPFCTLTMARLLATQGYKPRALTIYRELLARSPGDDTLRAELEALEGSG